MIYAARRPLLLVLVLTGLVVAPLHVSAANMQITGQAWSSGLTTPFMGWIEFGTPYYDFDNNGITDVNDVSILQSLIVGAQACPANKVCDVNKSGAVTLTDSGTLNIAVANQTLGVYEDDVTGNLAGHAWSTNLGWVTFNSTETTGCPVARADGSCNAKVDLTNGLITGWARACSAFAGNLCSGTPDARAGGWDGWIALSGTAADNTVYGLNQNADCTWSGSGWGSEGIAAVIVRGTTAGGTTFGVKGPTNNAACAPVANVPNLAAYSTAVVTVAPRVNQNISFSAQVRNVGGSAALSVPNVFQIRNNAGTTVDWVVGTTIASIGAAGIVNIANSGDFFNTPTAGDYTVRACANWNATGLVNSAINESRIDDNCAEPWVPFTVSAPVAPTVSQPTASSVTADAATFSTTINDGGSAVTARKICWSTAATPIASAPASQCSTASTGAGTLTWRPTGLPVATLIYYQAQATNAINTTNSAVANLRNGSCGLAATAYPYGAIAYSGAFCSTGTANPLTPAFPAVGGNTTWTCTGSGTSGFFSPSCTATREGAPLPPSGTFTAAPLRVPRGGNTLLSWNSVANVTSCSISQKIGLVTTTIGSGLSLPAGSQSAEVNDQTQYTLTCPGTDGVSTLVKTQIVNLIPDFTEF